MTGKFVKTAFFLLLMSFGLSPMALTEDLNVQWIKEFGSSGPDYSQGIACDPAGNICLTGYTEASLGGNRHIGGADMFVAKYNADGQELWIRQLGTIESDQGAALACDAVGNIYVTGHTYGSFEGKTNAGGADIFLIKLEPSGKILWIKQFGSSESDYGLSVTSDRDGNAYVVGDTYGKLTGTRNHGEADVFIMKFDPFGDRLWGAQFGTAFAEHTKIVLVDTSGNIYVAGYTEGTFAGNKNAGYADMFIISFKINGLVLCEQEGITVLGGSKGFIEPAKDEKLYIMMCPNKEGHVEIEIHALSGQLIWENAIMAKEKDQEMISWDGKDQDGKAIVPGMYQLKIKGAGIDLQEKIAVVQ